MIIKQILFVFTCRKQKKILFVFLEGSYTCIVHSINRVICPHKSIYCTVLATYPGRNTMEAVRSTRQAIVNAPVSHRHNTLGTYTITL